MFRGETPRDGHDRTDGQPVQHGIKNTVIVADAGMLPKKNLTALDEAGYRFIVGSRMVKAPIDLASHSRWHGDAFADGQIIDTLTAQENRARAAVDGDKPTRRPRFVKATDTGYTLDEASIARARKLAGLKGYVTKARQARARARTDRALPRPMARGTVLPHVEIRPRSQTLLRPQTRRDRSPPHDHIRRAHRRTRHPTPCWQVHPACDPCAAAPALSRHHQQRHHPNHPTSHQPRPTNPHRRRQNPTLAQALTHVTQLRPDGPSRPSACQAALLAPSSMTRPPVNFVFRFSFRPMSRRRNWAQAVGTRLTVRATRLRTRKESQKALRKRSTDSRPNTRD